MTLTAPLDADTLAINTVRALCMDAIQRANSGHPGTPMGVAPPAYPLRQRFLRFDPADPIWPNRDRFVLWESVASVFMSRWDRAVAKRVPADLRNQLALAVGLDVYRAYRQLMDSDRFQALENVGVDLDQVAAQLQRDGADSFVTAWNDLMDRIQTQTSAVA